MTKWVQSLSCLRGVTSIEYAVIAATMAVVVLTATFSVGGNMMAMYNSLMALVWAI
jgi:Flp pilus assembly pilin Flp